MNKVTINEINFRNRRALVRVDFNVPMDDNQNITDDRRIKESLLTIEKIIKDGGKAILCSHLGRPKGNYDAKLSLKPVAERLSQLLGQDVAFAEDCIGPEASNMVDKLQDGQALLLENLRFHEGEIKNDIEFCRKLSEFADIFVNDAFGTAHRAHASTQGVTKFFRQSVAGLLMENEIEFLNQALTDPKKPFVAIIGGAKISGKIDVLQSLLRKVDSLLIGGGMAFTFAKAMGYETGKSLVEEDKVKMAKEIIDECQKLGKTLVFPTDAVVASEITQDAETEIVAIDKIPSDKMGLDIGPATIKLFEEHIVGAGTIVWNGPMGVFEIEKFSVGTYQIANIMSEQTAKGTLTIVGGGDSSAAVHKSGFEDKFSLISTGGGATLEFLEGKPLPGVEALTNRADNLTKESVNA